jgi:hypothetical protein
MPIPTPTINSASLAISGIMLQNPMIGEKSRLHSKRLKTRYGLITTFRMGAYDLSRMEMNAVDQNLTSVRGTKLLRVLLFINFAFLLLLIGPGSSRQLYLVERRMGLAHVITRSLQFWFVGSTVIVTVLFIRMLISRSQSLRSQSPAKLDWALFLSWWFVVAIYCMFAFMMGMGG